MPLLHCHFKTLRTKKKNSVWNLAIELRLWEKILLVERQQCITNILISMLSSREKSGFPIPQGIRSHQERGTGRSSHVCVRGDSALPKCPQNTCYSNNGAGVPGGSSSQTPHSCTHLYMFRLVLIIKTSFYLNSLSF